MSRPDAKSIIGGYFEKLLGNTPEAAGGDAPRG